MSDYPVRRRSLTEEPKKTPTGYPSVFSRFLICVGIFCFCISVSRTGAFDQQTNQLKKLLSTHSDPETVRIKTEQVWNNLGSFVPSLEVGAQSPEDSTRQYEIIQKEESVPVVAKTVFNIPARGVITSEFGQRTDPLNESSAFHTGLDIAANTGTPILAAAEGEVIHAGELGGYGFAVKLRHKDGLVTLYGHCSELLVTEGEQVYSGQEIAKMGSTGRSTGPHLHFEIIDGEEYLNPADFLSFV